MKKWEQIQSHKHPIKNRSFPWYPFTAQLIQANHSFLASCHNFVMIFPSIFKRIEPQEWTPMWFDLPCLHYKIIFDMNLLLKALTVPFLHFLIFQRKKRHLQNAVISKLVMQWIYCNEGSCQADFETHTFFLATTM